MDLTQISDPQNFGQIYKEAVNNFDARSRSVAPTVSSKMDNEIKVHDEVSVKKEIAGALRAGLPQDDEVYSQDAEQHD
jgi:hypothetical protein